MPEFKRIGLHKKQIYYEVRGFIAYCCVTRREIRCDGAQLAMSFDIEMHQSSAQGQLEFGQKKVDVRNTDVFNQL